MGIITHIIILDLLGGLIFGYNTAVVNGVIVMLPKWTHSQTEIFTSCVVFGAAIGSGIGGPFADRLGRRKATIWSSVLSAVFAGLLFMDNFWVLTACRTMLGVGIGMQTSAIPMLVSELARKELRGRLTVMYQIFVTIGIMIGYIANMALKSWESMLVLGAVPSIFIIFWGPVYLSESPFWLIVNNRVGDALLVLRQIHATEDEAKDAADEMAENHAREKLLEKASWKEVLTVWKKPLWASMVLAVSQQLTGINVLIYYSSSFLEAAGIRNPAAATLGVGVWNFLCTCLALPLVDKLGRRPLLLAGMFGLFISNFFLGASYLANDGAGSATFLVLGLIIFIFFFEIGPGPLFFVVISEIAPLRVKGRMVALAVLVQWVANLAVTLTFLSISDITGPGPTFMMYGTVALVAFVFFIFLIPETKGRDLAAIHESLRSIPKSSARLGSSSPLNDSEGKVIISIDTTGRAPRRRGSQRSSTGDDADSGSGSSYQTGEEPMLGHD